MASSAQACCQSTLGNLARCFVMLRLLLFCLGFVLQSCVNDFHLSNVNQMTLPFISVAADLLVTNLLSPHGCQNNVIVVVDPTSGIVLAACNNGDASDGIFAIIGSQVTRLANSSECPTPLALQLRSDDSLIYALCGSNLLIINSQVETFQTTVLAHDLPVQCDTASLTFAVNSSSLFYLICNQLSQGRLASPVSTLLTISWSGQLSPDGTPIGDVNITIFQPNFAYSCSYDIPNNYYIAINPVAQLLYVLCSASGDVTAVPLNDESYADYMVVSGIPSALLYLNCRAAAFNDAIDVLYVGCDDHGILAFVNLKVSTVPTSCLLPMSLGVNRASGVLYVGCANGGVVMVNAGSESTVVSPPLCASPSSVVVNPVSRVVYVGCISDSFASVQSINGATTDFVVSCQANLNANFWTDPATGDVYATCNTQILVMNGNKSRYIANSTDCEQSGLREALSVAVDSSRGVTYVVCSKSLSYSIQALNGSAYVPIVPSSVALQCEPTHITVDPVTRNVYVACLGFNQLYHVNQNSLTPLLHCQNPGRMVINPLTETLYVVCETVQIWSVNLTSFAPRSVTPSNCVPNAIDVHFRSNVLYVSCSSGTVIALNGSNFTSNPTVLLSADRCSTGAGANGVAVHQSTGTIFVACSTNGVLSISPNGFHLQTVISPATCFGSSINAVVSVAVNSAGFVYATCNNGIVAATLAALAACPPGFTYTSIFASTCTPCLAGTYFSYADSLSQPLLLQPNNSCTVCPVGQVARLPGFASCSACPAGKAASDSLACYSCSSGYYSEAGSDSCFPCSPGNFSSNAISSSCSQCWPGRFSSANGSPACIPCAPGQFSNISGASSCDACPSGKYSNANGFSQCLACSNGQVATNNGSVQCNACPRGTFASAFGVCVNCEIGYYQSNSSSTVCVPCEKGKFSAFEASVSCIPCAAGQFSNGTAASSCSPCDPGLFANVSGLTECLQCSPGTYSSAFGSPGCNFCGPGQYNDMFSASFCHPCPSGKYSDSRGLSECLPCGIGAVATTLGSVLCNPCPEGTYANFTGVCVNCDKGYYQPNSSSTSCAACEAGKYSSFDASPSCVLCASGQFSNRSGASACVSCPVGTFSTTIGLTSCLPCLHGAVTNQTGSVQCNACPQGTYADDKSEVCVECPFGFYQSEKSSTACLPCEAGKYTSSTASPICIDCPTGQFNAVNASSTCSICPGGMFSNTTGLSVCLPCEIGTFQNTSQPAAICLSCSPGTYQNSSFGVICLPCDVGRYSSNYGASECTSCSAGTSSNVLGSNHCMACGVGTYQFLNGSSGCHSCASIAGIVCQNQDADPSQQLLVLPGWFAYVDDSASLTIATSQCPSSSCVGGVWSPEVPNQCGPYRTQRLDNYLCGQCDADHSEVNGQCVECNGINGPLLFVVLFGCWLYVLCVHLNSKSKSSGVMTIFIYNLQTALLLTGPYADWTAWINVFSFTPANSSSECIVPLTPMENLAVGVIISLVFFVLNACNYCIQWAGHQWIYIPFYAPHADEDNEQHQSPAHASARAADAAISDSALANPTAGVAEQTLARRYHDDDRHFRCCSIVVRKIVNHVFAEVSGRAYIRSTLSLLLFTYAQVTVGVFRYLQCINVSGALVVYTSPAVSCNSSEYAAFLPLVLVLLVVYVIGFPFAITIRLCCKRKVVHLARAASVRINRLSVSQKLQKFQQQQKEIALAADATDEFRRRQSIGIHTVVEESDLQPRPSLRALPNIAKVASASSIILDNSPRFPSSVREQSSQTFTRGDAENSEVFRFSRYWALLYEAYAERTHFWHAVILVRRTVVIILYTFLHQFPSERQAFVVVLHGFCLFLNIQLRPFRRSLANVLESVSLTLLMMLGLILTDYPLSPYPTPEQVLLTLLTFVPAFCFIIIVIARALMANGLLPVYINSQLFNSANLQSHMCRQHSGQFSSASSSHLSLYSALSSPTAAAFPRSLSLSTVPSGQSPSHSHKKSVSVCQCLGTCLQSVSQRCSEWFMQLFAFVLNDDDEITFADSASSSTAPCTCTDSRGVLKTAASRLQSEHDGSPGEGYATRTLSAESESKNILLFTSLQSPTAIELAKISPASTKRYALPDITSEAKSERKWRSADHDQPNAIPNQSYSQGHSHNLQQFQHRSYSHSHRSTTSLNLPKMALKSAPYFVSPSESVSQPVADPRTQPTLASYSNVTSQPIEQTASSVAVSTSVPLPFPAGSVQVPVAAQVPVEGSLGGVDCRPVTENDGISTGRTVRIRLNDLNQLSPEVQLAPLSLRRVATE